MRNESLADIVKPFLADLDGSMTRAEVSAYLGVHPNTVLKYLSELEREGVTVVFSHRKGSPTRYRPMAKREDPKEGRYGPSEEMNFRDRDYCRQARKVMAMWPSPTGQSGKSSSPS